MSDFAFKKQDYSRPWVSRCYRSGCNNEVLNQKGIYYTYCKDCLKVEGIGPFYKSKHKNDYSFLFWDTDYERKYK